MNPANETWTFKGHAMQRSQSGKGILVKLLCTGEDVWLPFSQIHIKQGDPDQIIVPRWLIDKSKKLQNEFDEMP